MKTTRVFCVCVCVRQVRKFTFKSRTDSYDVSLHGEGVRVNYCCCSTHTCLDVMTEDDEVFKSDVMNACRNASSCYFMIMEVDTSSSYTSILGCVFVCFPFFLSFVLSLINTYTYTHSSTT